MKIIKKAILSLAALLSLGACDMNLSPVTSLTYNDPNEIFDTYDRAESFSEGLNAYYRSALQGLFWEISDTQTDMFNSSKGSGNRGGTIHSNNNGFTPSDQDISFVWNFMYSFLYQVNSYLANVANVDTTELSEAEMTNLNQWTGQAHFYRAFINHYLAVHFCPAYDASSAASELGLPLITVADISLRPSRANLEETYEFIVADITKAKELITIGGFVRATFPTVDAATALSARINLSMKNYTAAYADANSLIEGGKYALASTADAMNAEFITQDGTETLFQPTASLTETGRDNAYYISFVETSTASGRPVDLYTADFLPNANLTSLYEAGDLRVNAYIGQLQLRIGSIEAFRGPLFTKYLGNPALTTQSYHANVTKARAIAITEMYLTAAEAAFYAGNTANAKTALNALQTARAATATEATEEAIRNEWAKETVGEGMRLACLKRWNIGFDGRPADSRLATVVTEGTGYEDLSLPAGYYRFNWPIPTNDIQGNPNMVQNKGWNAL